MIETSPNIYPRKLSGSLWGITTFFNSSGYANKCENYRTFRLRSKRQGLRLLCVELAFDDDPFTLRRGRDAEILIPIRGTREKNALWQKERLLNLALEHLPADCDKVCWIDCDVLFQNDAWVRETAKRLEKYVAVQPFDSAVRLPPGVRACSEAQKKKLDPRHVKASLVYQRVNHLTQNGEVGFAWAARRDLLRKTGFYDALPTGGQDVLLASCLVGDAAVAEWLRVYSTDTMRADQDRYRAKVCREAQGSVSYTRGTILHLWHGNLDDRLYVMRWKILRHFAFAPGRDIRVDAKGIWEWASNKPGLHRAIRDYFAVRNEEGKSAGVPSSLLKELVVSQRKMRALERRVNAIRATQTYGVLRKLAISLRRKGAHSIPGMGLSATAFIRRLTLPKWKYFADLVESRGEDTN